MLPKELINSELESVVRSLVERCNEIYLVGGVVRDFIIKNPSNDIDFVVKQKAITAARSVADHFKGDFYVLDDERETARALININGKTLVVDFATISGNDIQEDLGKRDFTINAIAQRINEPWNPIDPMGGIRDLEKSLLRPCGTHSFELDPVRVIRAVRFIQRLDLQIENEDIKLLKGAVPLLKNVSAERKRDEIFHIFETRNVKSSMNMMREFGLWDELFPSLKELEQIDNIPPHVHNALEHTLAVLDYCQRFLQAISENEKLGDQLPQSLDGLIKKYRKNLNAFLAAPIHPHRKYDGLLFLAVLYHDIGKLYVPAETSGERIKFPNHAEASSRFFKDNHCHWALSNTEYHFVRKIISNHTLPKEIKGTGDENSRRAIYRFYQKADSAGVLISLFHLADILATYEENLTEERWQQAMATSTALLESWFQKHEQIIDPPKLLNGSDLIQNLGLKQGKQVGQLLEAIREAQSAGIVKDRKTAVEYAENLLEKNGL